MPTQKKDNTETLKRIKNFFKKEKVKDIAFDVALLGGGLLAIHGLKNLINAEKQETRQEIHKEIKFKAPDLNKKHKIPPYKNGSDFDKIYQEALPLIQIALQPTEVMVLIPYDDRGGNDINTVGVGCCYVPPDGNVKAKKWVHMRQYFPNHPEYTVSGDLATDLVGGSFDNRDYAAINRSIHKNLTGKSVNLKRIAVAYSIALNNPKRGREFCEFIKDNTDDFACMEKIMSFVPASCSEGIACRRVHEALMLLNRNDYISKIPDFYIAKYPNGYITSVTQIGGKNAKRFKKAVMDRDMKVIDEIQILREEIYNDELRAKLLCFSDVSTKYTGIEPFALTEEVMSAYKNADFQKAIKAYEELHVHGYGHNDSIYAIAADSYFKTGNYDRCLSICKTFVNSIKDSPHKKDILRLAGAAYENKGNNFRALANYKASAILDKDNEAIKGAIKRIEPLLKKENQAKNTVASKKAIEVRKRVDAKNNKKAAPKAKKANNASKKQIKQPVRKDGRKR